MLTYTQWIPEKKLAQPKENPHQKVRDGESELQL